MLQKCIGKSLYCTHGPACNRIVWPPLIACELEERRQSFLWQAKIRQEACLDGTKYITPLTVMPPLSYEKSWVRPQKSSDLTITTFLYCVGIPFLSGFWDVRVQAGQIFKFFSTTMRARNFCLVLFLNTNDRLQFLDMHLTPGVRAYKNQQISQIMNHETTGVSEWIMGQERGEKLVDI